MPDGRPRYLGLESIGPFGEELPPAENHHRPVLEDEATNVAKSGGTAEVAIERLSP